MNLSDAEAEQTRWLTCGNESAADFLRLWRAYVHAIDDIIDGDAADPESILAAFMQAAFVYTHPFFTANAPALRQLAVNCTNAYADSVAWEKSPDAWRRQFSDHYRHYGAEMVLAIASLCGGYQHMRSVSLTLRETCYTEHHDNEGAPI